MEIYLLKKYHRLVNLTRQLPIERYGGGGGIKPQDPSPHRCSEMFLLSGSIVVAEIISVSETRIVRARGRRLRTSQNVHGDRVAFIHIFYGMGLGP